MYERMLRVVQPYAEIFSQMHSPKAHILQFPLLTPTDAGLALSDQKANSTFVFVFYSLREFRQHRKFNFSPHSNIGV